GRGAGGSRFLTFAGLPLPGCGFAWWRDSWCRWSAGPSAVAGSCLGGGGVGGPRPGRREYVHVGFSATSVSPKPGRRPPTPPPRTIAGAAAEGPARHLPGPSPALVAAAQQTRPGGPSETRRDDAS